MSPVITNAYFARQLPLLPDFEDDFTSDGWTDNGTDILVNTSTEVMDFDTSAADVTHGTYIDIGLISDTAWILRFKFTVNNISVGSDSTGAAFLVGLSSINGAGNMRTVQDGIFFFHNIASGGNAYGIRDTDGAGPILTASDAIFAHTPTTETIYNEVIRLTATTYSAEIFSNSAYTTSVESESGTVSSSTASLRWIRAANDGGSDGTEDHTMNGTIDDVKFWDGITSL